MATSVHRVVVRGQFDGLTDEQRAALLAEATEHEIFRASYEPWGSFTYEPNLVSFSFRYEVRMDSEEADGAPTTAAAERGLELARASMAEWGLAFKHLRATATDMATVWRDER